MSSNFGSFDIRIPVKIRDNVAYATFAESTVDIVRVVAEEIAKRDLQVHVMPLGEVKSLDGYDGGGDDACLGRRWR